MDSVLVFSPPQASAAKALNSGGSGGQSPPGRGVRGEGEHFQLTSVFLRSLVAMDGLRLDGEDPGS